MEPQIDALGFAKLEVKLNLKGEVRAFVCAVIEKELDDITIGDGKYCMARLVVFDNKGKCYITCKEIINTEGQFYVDFINCNGYRVAFINSEEMMRAEDMDLKAN